ncbi:hypothetical protein NQ315_004653 [Exocentrus adspersus]|uniref:Secreted protein n=1 Tax=Exocentrus adspersus TaxID=1586481 RepID=A0AAV8VNY6_9CUCU|nr:hypothetical protein NQ315_004653 [Exocentrus adspersus]
MLMTFCVQPLQSLLSGKKDRCFLNCCMASLNKCTRTPPMTKLSVNRVVLLCKQEQPFDNSVYNIISKPSFPWIPVTVKIF